MKALDFNRDWRVVFVLSSTSNVLHLVYELRKTWQQIGSFAGFKRILETYCDGSRRKVDFSELLRMLSVFIHRQASLTIIKVLTIH